MAGEASMICGTNIRMFRAQIVIILLAVAAMYSTCAHALSTHTLESAEWSLISIPADPGSAGTLAVLFGDDLPVATYGQTGNWLVVDYDTSANAYRVLGLNDTLTPNTGYWIIQITEDSVELDLPDSLSPLEGARTPGCPADQLCASKTIMGGDQDGQWNLVGSSLDRTVVFGDTRFQSDEACTTACTPTQAVAANAISSPSYVYTGSGYTEVVESTAIPAWSGIWIAAFNNTVPLSWILAVGDAPPSPESPMTAAEKDATRLLMQASFGPTEADIDSVLALGGPADWIDAQLALPVQRHLPLVNQLFPYTVDVDRQQGRYEVFWQRALRANDQLRQRIAFALSQILVISDRSGILEDHGNQTAAYYDVLVNNAFGNYRQLLQEVTLSPAMGVYLSMLGNEKPNIERGLRADENFARELMQLFSIGLVSLNLDGTERPGLITYVQPDVENLARALTGWFWDVERWIRHDRYAWWPNRVTLERPMVAFEEYHDTDEKTILGRTFPAGQTAEQDLNMALDLLFNHPNVGPFVSKQLIKRLVTSNPSNGYVRRVATIFNNNGAGVRGDLAAVVKAILLDNEARSPAISDRSDFGKLREPLLRYAHMWRAFRATDPIKLKHWMINYVPQAAPLTSPSVFNDYSPDYAPPGSITEANLTAPEFQINSGSRLNTVNSVMMRVVQNDFLEDIPVTLNLQKERQLLNSDPVALLDHLDRLLTAGRLSAASRQILTDYIDANGGRVESERLIRDVVGLVLTSTEFAIQR